MTKPVASFTAPQQTVSQNFSEQENLLPTTGVALTSLSHNQNTFASILPPIFFQVSAPLDYSTLTLNPAALSKVPVPFDWTTLSKTGGDIPVEDILQEYRNVVAEYSRDNLRPDTSAKDLKLLKELIDLTNQQGTTSYQTIYHATLKTILQNIILELRRNSSEIPIEKKMRALDEMIEAQALSDSARLEECLRQYKLLKSSTPEMEQLLLEYIQNLKEECLIEAFQGRDIHVLNWARNCVGKELGLNVSVLDPYLAVGHRDANLLHNEFNERYTPKALVEGVMAKMHLEETNRACLEYIRFELESRARARKEDPSDEIVAKKIINEVVSFFNEGQINQRGVIFLLRSLGILN